MRNSDPDAAVYWVARMLEAGEDPLYIARRLIRFASEDIGNADPQALTVAVAAKDAAHFIGMPEGNTALAQAAIYLATAPKSNAVYTAYNAQPLTRTEAAEPVPLHLRNAPTRLMKQLEYGKGYQYAHDDPDAVTGMECLPPSLADKTYYRPTDRGLRKRSRDGWRLGSSTSKVKRQRSKGKSKGKGQLGSRVRCKDMLRSVVVLLVAVVVVSTLAAQTAIPTREGAAVRRVKAGRVAAAAAPAPRSICPQAPVAAPLPTISAEITGPGSDLRVVDGAEAGRRHGALRLRGARILRVSGTANGQPYTTRIVVRRPADAAKFSGLVLAESMHPSGNAWMFHFTHAYSMTAGHIGLDILTSTSVPFAEFNAERYKTLRVGQGQAPEILAQVGALMKSKQPGNPLAMLPVRKMILAGTSASAAALINYLPRTWSCASPT